MKITVGKLKQLVREATGGDGRLERVDQTNFQHLEVGNTYIVKAGRDRLRSVFQGWVDEAGATTESEDVNTVKLKFADVADGFEWEAYWFENGARSAFAVGSSADTLFVKEE